MRKQNEAACIVTGATKLDSIDSLIHETGYETLLNRKQNHKLLLFYKMQNNLSPDYLYSLVPPTIGDTTNYPLGNSSNLLTVYTSLQFHYNSFLPPVKWKELPEDVCNLPSIATFKRKRKLNSDVTKIPSFYFDGVRLG